MANEPNHYRLMAIGREARTRCGLLVPRGNAVAATPVTCPDCRRLLLDKVALERATASTMRPGQERRFHEATAAMFAATVS